jgi:4-oxalocrotonate tautomerase
MPIVTVAMYEGRTIDQKREIVKGITDVVARVTGNDAESVHVVIEEVKRENWAIGGLLHPDRQAAPSAERPAGVVTPSQPRGRPVKVSRGSIPSLELTKGMNTQFNVCHETVGADALRMGVCNHAPDMADLTWTAKAEEAFYVVKGSIRVRWESEDGDKGETLAREGEQIFLPRGLSYALQATGEPAVNVFAIAGGPTSVGAVVGPAAGDKLRAAAAHLS